MNESWVTLQGWVGGEVNPREAGGTTVPPFRLGCTPRYCERDVDRRADVLVHGHCWRALGRNVAESVRSGDAVVVHGRVRVDVWEREGQPPSVTWVVDASFVGHDLNRGTSRFLRVNRPDRTSPPSRRGAQGARARLRAGGAAAGRGGPAAPGAGRVSGAHRPTIGGGSLLPVGSVTCRSAAFPGPTDVAPAPRRRCP